MTGKHFWRAIAVVVLFFTVLLASGCAHVPRYLEFREGAFSAMLCGVHNGVRFKALVEAEEIGEGDMGRTLRISYTEPVALAGITLECRADQSVVMRQGGMELYPDAARVEGLLEPLSVLMVEEEIASIKREGDRTVLSFPSDHLKLTLSETGMPLSVAADDLCFDVVSWE